jgi:predicted flap endonuclease-1-like 5' DNA nuclease
MSYPIHEIQGIGPNYASKLLGIGINTVAKLLEDGATRTGRLKLTETTGISESLILTWVNHADLMRINGIGDQFAELLEAAGVDTVKELRNRVPENLHAKVTEVNGLKNLSGRVPTLKELEGMIEMAKDLDPVVTY